jgi:hypothetical protein
MEKTGEDDVVREFVVGSVEERGFVKSISCLQRAARERME